MNIGPILQRVRFSKTTAEITRKKIIQRLHRLCTAINEKFPEVRQPNQIKLKHLLYIKNEWFAECQMSSATIEDYKRCMRLMVSSLGKENAWLTPLKLKLDPLKGGRPTVAKVIQSRAKNRRGVR